MRNLSIIFGMIFLSTLYCATEDEDLETFNRWIQDKHLVTVKKEKGDLSIGGEVRVEYQNNQQGISSKLEKESGQTVKKPSLSNGYDVEINLMLDYRADRMWGSIKLEFDNDMGSQSGQINQLCLEKAFFGGRILDYPTFTFDAEIGRRYLADAFTSKVQFGSRFDGLLFRIDKSFKTIAQYYANAAVFLVSDAKGRYAEAFETGLMDIGDSGLGVQYSLINWKKNPYLDEEEQRFNFVISQVTLSKKFYLPFLDKPLVPYVAGLMNTSAKRTEQSNFKKSRTGYYTGLSIGKIKKRGDWSLDTNYQYIKAQAIPEFDNSGIGKGNPNKRGFYTKNLDGSGESCSCEDAVGKNNFQGFRAEFLYALYDNLTIFNCYQTGSTLDSTIGPDLQFKQFEIELIYSF